MEIMCFRGGGGRGDEENRLIFICTSKNGSKNIGKRKWRQKVINKNMQETVFTPLPAPKTHLRTASFPGLHAIKKDRF